jgi:Gnt-I system low-affinity gluconate transporter
VILFGFIVGFPTAIIAGPYFGSYIAKKIRIDPPALTEEELVKLHEQNNKLPSFLWVIFLIGLPLVLILMSTLVEMGLKMNWWEPSKSLEIVRFIGHPFVALMLATLAASYFLGIRNGFSRKSLLDMANRALGPAGLIILVTGAGGVFKQVLVDSGAGAALAEAVSGLHIAPVVLAYLLAVIIRLTQGSATVAMITSAGMMAPILTVFDLNDPQKGLIVLAIAAGATIFSHVNDSGFWLIGKYLNMTEKQTLRSWSVMETIVSVVGFIFVLILSWFV